MKQLMPFTLFALLVGCGGGSSYVHSDATLGRVVVYRNGVAYFERYAKVDEDSLKLAVPADKVDDFLKSLTVVDVKTGKPAPVAYPTNAPNYGTGLIDMKIRLLGPGPHRLRLSYVTEAPAWKPSYRVVLGKGGKVDLQAWAIVDNTSGEDWHDVKLGVGSSSAMSFRFDLRSLRMVERETLQSNDVFAVAPPAGGSVYGDSAPDGQKKVATFSDEAIIAAGGATPVTPPNRTVTVVSPIGDGILRGKITDATNRKGVRDVVLTLTSPAIPGEQIVTSDASGSYQLRAVPSGTYTLRVDREGYRPYQREHVQIGTGANVRLDAELLPEGLKAESVIITGRTPTVDLGSSMGGSSSATLGSPNGDVTPRAPKTNGTAPRSPEPPPPEAPPPPSPVDALAQRMNRTGNTNQFVIEGYADPKDADKERAALDRANKVRDQLVRRGVDPGRLSAIGRNDVDGSKGGVRVLEKNAAGAADKPKPAEGATTAEPIGISHFESGVTMSVPRGSSAMVSILNAPTDGEAVYLYDPESPRGNASFAFKAVRIRNPTDSALESGPVSVFGEGRFIGEGISEPIPPRTVAFVPFALDRQIVVEAKNDERDQIARVLTVQRGVFSAEVEHTRRSTWTLHNRLGERAVVYIRHTVPKGYKLTSNSVAPVERIGGANLYRIELGPGAKKDIAVDEQAPEFKTIDVRTSGGMDLVRVFLSSSALEGPLKAEVSTLLKVQQDIGNIEQRISTVRDQMQEYRARMDELHAQIVTLRAVKTAGPLMQSLERKLQEVGDHLSKSTVEVVSLQEKLMVARVRFQDGVADLTLEKKSANTNAQNKLK